ncbi:putative heat shock factor protein [Halenospora varia]|nr:putative heat shock factor protein [Halenospora varia]
MDPQQGGIGLEENDNIELLEERAAIAKRDAQSKRKQIPPFVQKLSSFLDESKNTELIRWSDRGDSFVVLDEDEFAKTLIPELFKHNNYASFVRQLNMYGFHKRVGLSDNSMKASERKNKSPSEYYNPYFKRGHPNLLWLINKPKGGTTKVKGQSKRVKNEDGDNDSDEDGRDGVEEIYRENMPGTSRALSQAPESGPLQKRELAVVQHQLAQIQKQQGAITGALNQLRKDHANLFQQSLNFQQLHDRHENSINAILTFLATVYNRSLDGNGPQNIAQMFGNGIPHEQHNQGNVVEIGEPANQQQNPTTVSPVRRQRLLMAPPSSGRANTLSPAASTPRGQTYNTPTASGNIEELLETSPPDTTQVKTEQDQQRPGGMMMNIINNTNAQAGSNMGGLEFPEMLQHYENANGQSPLTSEQRNSVLNMIANGTSAPGTNNALVSPTPPQPLSLENLGNIGAEMDKLLDLQNDTNSKIEDVKHVMQPLDVSTHIPGLDDNPYYTNGDTGDLHKGNYDLDQYLDPGAFYTSSSPVGGADYGYDHFGDANNVMGDSHFDLGMDGTNDNGRIVEAVDNSESATPDHVMEDVAGNGVRGPSKKRRKN